MQPFGRGSDRKLDADGVRAARVCFALTPALSPKESICLAERGHSCPQQRTLLDLGLYSGCAFVRKMLRTGMSSTCQTLGVSPAEPGVCSMNNQGATAAAA